MRDARQQRNFKVRRAARLIRRPFARVFRNREQEVMSVLRVSYSEAADGQRWILSGRLAGPWVDELRSCWRYARELAPRAHCVVDLSDVTFIDEAGEALLSEMHSAAAEFVVAGVENKYLLATLSNNSNHASPHRVQHPSGVSGKPKQLKEETNE